MNVQLIINADDYAISPGVSKAIRALLMAGRITATSCMTGSEFWAKEGVRLRNLQCGPYSAGLHVTLTEQSSCIRTETLAPNGVLPSLGQLWRGVCSGKIKRIDIEAEILAQIRQFSRVYGGPPGHVDGHHHVQQLPVVRDVILGLWMNGTLPAETWLRVSADSLPRIFKRGSAPLKALFIAAAGCGLRSETEKRGISVNDGFAGAYDLKPGSDFSNVCRRAIAVPSPRMVFMCHPGHADIALEEKDSVTEQRDVEYDFLMSETFLTLLDGFAGKLVARFD